MTDHSALDALARETAERINLSIVEGWGPSFDRKDLAIVEAIIRAAFERVREGR